MKKILAILLVAVMAFSFAACGGVEGGAETSTNQGGEPSQETSGNQSTEPTTPTHEHTFEEDWTTDAYYHWHKATYEHTDEVSDKAKHSFGEDGICTACGMKELSPSEGLEFTLLGPYYFVSGIGTCTDTDIVIPETYDGKPVWGIMGAFDNCTNITSVVIPTSFDVITGGFYGCTGLKSVTIPDSVTSISVRAFYGCTSLSSITIPDSVTSIQLSAFQGCSSLTSLVIPKGVAEIGSGAFDGCTALTSIRVETGNQTYHSAGNCLIETESKKMILGCKTSVIPSDGSVTTIESAFRDCKELTNIEIPNGIVDISGAFYGCKGLSDITIPESVASIGSLAFFGCTGITNITISNAVTSIGEYALYGCLGLTSITFNGTKAQFDAISKGNGWRSNTGEFSVSCTDGTIAKSDSGEGNPPIHEHTFEDTWSMDEKYHWKQSTCEHDVRQIGEHVFGQGGICSICGMNRSPETGELAYVWNEDMKSYSVYGIGTWKETDVVIPSSYNGKPVTKIHDLAFGDCTELTSITIPDSVESIGNSAFRGCTGLTNVTIGNGVTSIELGAFGGCTGLTSITIPDSVESIGNAAFMDCTGLSSITVGNGVTSIGSFILEGCVGLTSITVGEKNPVYHSAENCLIETEKKVLYAGCKTSVIPADGSVTSIGDNAFSKCAELTSIVIPNHVKSIGAWAFSGCTGLASITIPDGITSISNGTFADCTGLKSIIIPDDVTDIGAYAFRGCKGLTDVTMGNDVTNIGRNAFADCTGLKSIIIPDSVTIITSSFADCTNLRSVQIGSTTEITNLAFEGCTNLTSITYKGTMQQWEKEIKRYGWKSPTKNLTVHCTDGDIAK